MEQNMIEIKGVTMDFRRERGGGNSLKEFIVNLLKGKLRYDRFRAVDGVEAEIKKGEVVGIIGRNGAGKSTFLRMLTGEVIPDKGTVTLGDTVKIGYFSQECESMDPKMRVIDYIRETAEIVRTPEGNVTAAQMLERFLFKFKFHTVKLQKFLVLLYNRTLWFCQDSNQCISVKHFQRNINWHTSYKFRNNSKFN